MYISIPYESARRLEKLPGKAIYVYMLLRAELKYQKGRKDLVPINDIIKFPYHKASSCGINSHTFCRSIKHLITTGLVRIVEHGKCGSGRNPTLYQIF